jgi:hypothetical protein
MAPSLLQPYFFFFFFFGGGEPAGEQRNDEMDCSSRNTPTVYRVPNLFVLLYIYFAETEHLLLLFFQNNRCSNP